MTSVGKDSAGNIKMMQPLLKPFWQFLKKLNTELAFGPATPRHLPSGNENTRPHKNLQTIMQGSMIRNSQKWKQSNYFSTGKWIKKCGITHRMKYCSATKRNKILIHITT